MNEQSIHSFAPVPRGTSMRLADIRPDMRKGGRKNGLTPDRESLLRDVMEREARYSCKALAVEWNVAVSTVESWRQMVRQRMVNK